MDQPKKQPKVFTNNAAKVSVIPHIRNFYSLLVFSILIFLPVSSSYLLQFDNQTHQIISRLIAGERDQIIHSFIMNSLQDQQTILRECSGKEFNIQTGDSFYTVENYIVLGTYDIASPSHKKCTAPDYTFHSWGILGPQVFHETVTEIMDASLFPPKQHKIAWYGNIYSPASNTIEYTTRPLLIEFSNQYPHLFHFRHSPLDAKEKFVTIPEMIREYYYVLDIGGNGYSGRLKYLLFTNRPLFLVERRWIEYFHTDLQPYEHYIPIHANLSNLVEQALWAQQHAVECKRMALNALNFAKTNFTTENLSRRYREVIVDQCRYGPCIVATK